VSGCHPIPVICEPTAVASLTGEPLLYLGDDFPKTISWRVESPADGSA
jgi:hypothetical protein